MRHIVISGLSSSIVFFDSFRKKKATERKIRNLIFSTTFISIVSHPKNISARYDQNCISSLHEQYRVFLSDFNETWIFSTDFRKIFKYKISWKSVQWEPSCSIRTDRHDDAKGRFSQFCKRA